jgi:nitrite reductase (NO-forming)
MAIGAGMRTPRSFTTVHAESGAAADHCATPMIPYHLAHGMYGLMVVEPPGGWPKVDREFYVMQGDFYLTGDPTQSGVHAG